MTPVSSARKNEIARAELDAYGLITVRTLRTDEPMPQHLGTGYESMPVMNDFVWVAEKGEKIIGILMAAPCHGCVFFVRLCAEKDAPPMTVPLLFRKCVRDCHARGFKGYFTYVDPTREAERKFIPICRKAGGLQIASVQVGLVGNLEQAARF
jgi:hypothetical protein